MYIYNVTTNIEESVHEAWVRWMKEKHIPDMLATGKFIGAKMSKVLIEEDMGGVTYSVQFSILNRETLELYYIEDAPKLREEGQKLFAGKSVSFRTELEVVDEQLVTRPAATNYLFTYGTIQEKEVQLGVFSRTLLGEEDVLKQYRISNRKVANQYPNIHFTGKVTDVLIGKVYVLTPEELKKADDYEGEAYHRIEVVLGSEKKAWVYLAK